MINRDRLQATFVSLASIDSPSLQERRMADELCSRLKALGFKVTEDDAAEKIGGNTGNLYAFRQGELPGEPLLFSVHMDTVEPSRHKHPTLLPDGTITSDGTTVLGADDLSGVSELLEALASLEEEHTPVRSLEILLSVGEERHLLGSSVFDYGLIKAREAYVLDLEEQVGTAACQAPSLATFHVVFHGKTAHAGFCPEKGIHAIAMASRAVSLTELGRVGGDTTVNISRMEGSMPSTNIVPDWCELEGEVRSGSQKKLLEELEKLRKTFENTARTYGGWVEFLVHHFYQAYETAPDHPASRRYERACLAAGLTPRLVRTFGGSDLNHLSAHGICGLVVASAMYHVHSKEEYTRIADMEAVARMLTFLMTDESL